MQFYLTWNKNIYGPFSIEEIKKLHMRGKIPGGTLVARKGGEWKEFIPDEFFVSSSQIIKVDQSAFNQAATPSYENDVAVPWRDVLSLRFIRKPIIMIVLLLSGLPFLFQILRATVFFCWGIYFCLVWAGCFCLLLNPSKEIIKKSILFGIFTAMIGIPLLMLAQTIPMITYLYNATERSIFDGNYARLFTSFILGVGICEELTKILPLVFFAKNRHYSIETLMFMGIISGFGFAIAENIEYAGKFAEVMHEKLQNSSDATIDIYADVLNMQLLRFLSLPLLHASWTGIFAWFTWNWFEKKRLSFFFIGLIFTAILHGTYDSFCIVHGVIMTLVGLFCIYLLFTFMNLNSSDDDSILDIKLISKS